MPILVLPSCSIETRVRSGARGTEETTGVAGRRGERGAEERSLSVLRRPRVGEILIRIIAANRLVSVELR